MIAVLTARLFEWSFLLFLRGKRLGRNDSFTGKAPGYGEDILFICCMVLIAYVFIRVTLPKDTSD